MMQASHAKHERVVINEKNPNIHAYDHIDRNRGAHT